jgi:hypothetical protein
LSGSGAVNSPRSLALDDDPLSGSIPVVVSRRVERVAMVVPGGSPGKIIR